MRPLTYPGAAAKIADREQHLRETIAQVRILVSMPWREEKIRAELMMLVACAEYVGVTEAHRAYYGIKKEGAAA